MNTLLTVVAALFLFFAFRQWFVEAKKRIENHELRMAETEKWKQELEKHPAKTVPVPLQTTYSLGLYIDKRFWTDTVKVTPEELAYLQTQMPLRDDFAWGDIPYVDLLLKIERWYGGYDRIAFEAASWKDPLGRTPIPVIREYVGLPLTSYYEHRHVLWRQQLSDEGRETVQLSLEKLRVRCYAIRGRFGVDNDADIVFGGAPAEPTPDHMYIDLQLNGQLAEYAWPDDNKEEIRLPQIPFKATPWCRRYRHVDRDRGFTWVLYVHDLQRLAEHEQNFA